MNRTYYNNLADQALNGHLIERDCAKEILEDDKIELLPLLNAAFEVRQKYCGKEVSVHIINNGQNGHCPEDCRG